MTSLGRYDVTGRCVVPKSRVSREVREDQQDESRLHPRCMAPGAVTRATDAGEHDSDSQ
ncbi:MAG: hypothetical protein MAG715_00743 [Methanonatronarchaeales archaeon]|nr:hypothetical protein [Methanonatronarchaeales archaeon]